MLYIKIVVFLKQRKRNKSEKKFIAPLRTDPNILASQYLLISTTCDISVLFVEYERNIIILNNLHQELLIEKYKQLMNYTFSLEHINPKNYCHGDKLKCAYLLKTENQL